MAKRAALPRLDELLCFALYSASHAFTRAYKPLLDAIELTYPQYLVMITLWSEDDVTVGELGDKLMLESNTLTPLLKRLEAMGYLARRRDKADERQVRVKLTPSGRALEAKVGDLVGCVFEATGLSGAEVQRLRSDITKLRQNLLDAARAGMDRPRRSV
jgi:DNA-binding MarR family transcriptional regulator